MSTFSKFSKLFNTIMESISINKPMEKINESILEKYKNRYPGWMPIDLMSYGENVIITYTNAENKFMYDVFANNYEDFLMTSQDVFDDSKLAIEDAISNIDNFN